MPRGISPPVTDPFTVAVPGNSSEYFNPFSVRKPRAIVSARTSSEAHKPESEPETSIVQPAKAVLPDTAEFAEAEAPLLVDPDRVEASVDGEDNSGLTAEAEAQAETAEKVVELDPIEPDRIEDAAIVAASDPGVYVSPFADPGTMETGKSSGEPDTIRMRNDDAFVAPAWGRVDSRAKASSQVHDDLESNAYTYAAARNLQAEPDAVSKETAVPIEPSVAVKGEPVEASFDELDGETAELEAPAESKTLEVVSAVDPSATAERSHIEAVDALTADAAVDVADEQPIISVAEMTVPDSPPSEADRYYASSSAGHSDVQHFEREAEGVVAVGLPVAGTASRTVAAWRAPPPASYFGLLPTDNRADADGRKYRADWAEPYDGDPNDDVVAGILTFLFLLLLGWLGFNSLFGKTAPAADQSDQVGLPQLAASEQPAPVVAERADPFGAAPVDLRPSSPLPESAEFLLSTAPDSDALAAPAIVAPVRVEIPVSEVNAPATEQAPAIAPSCTPGKFLRAYFCTATTGMTPASSQRFEKELADWTTCIGSRELVVRGYADTRGTAGKNLGLADGRALSVAALLTAQGFSVADASGAGELSEIEDERNCSNQRRVDVWIKGETPPVSRACLPPVEYAKIACP